MFSIVQATRSGQPPFFLVDDEGGVVTETRDFFIDLMVRGMATDTIRAYAYDLLAFYRFMAAAKVTIQDITSRHVINFLLAQQSSKNSPRTINRRMIAIRSFLNSKYPDLGNKLFSSNTCSFYKGRRNRALLGPTRIASPASARLLRVKVPAKIIVPLSSDSIRFFIQQLGSLRDRAIALLMLCSGLRSFEILKLPIADIDLDDLWIRVAGKGGKDRLVPISTWTRDTIKRYIAYERPRSLAVNCFLVLKEPRRGQALSKAGLRQIFRYRRRFGVIKHITPHSFRHAFCTNLIRQNVPLPVVQKLMGHADIETTLIYVNLSLSDVASEYHRAMNIIEKQHATS